MEPTTKKWKNRKTKKRICSKVSVNTKTVQAIHGVSPVEEKESYGGKDLQKRKVLSTE